MEFDFVRKEDCKTTACHGGWIGLATLDPKQQDWQTYKATSKLTLAIIPQRIMDKYYVSWPLCEWFEAGADVFAKMLFHTDDCNHTAIYQWAYENPNLWGNKFGSEMFLENGYKSFGKFRTLNSKGELLTPQVTIKEIITHWLGVADRIETINRD